MAASDLHAVAFPKFTADQMAGLADCHLCRRKRYRDGEGLFRAGDRDPQFYVVVAGRIEIVDELGDAPRTIAVHDPGAFAGDVSLISGRPAVVSGYARGDTDVYEVTPGALKQLLNHDPDLGDMILQATTSSTLARPSVFGLTLGFSFGGSSRLRTALRAVIVGEWTRATTTTTPRARAGGRRWPSGNLRRRSSRPPSRPMNAPRSQENGCLSPRSWSARWQWPA